jgi:hypothetical protein
VSGPLDFPDDEPSGPERRGPAPPPAPPPSARPAGTRTPPPSSRPAGTSRYGWFLGVVAVLLLAVVTLNTVGTEGVGGGPEGGQRLVPFAVPLATAPRRPDEDANLGEGACAVRGPGVLNLCALAERGPLVLALFPTDAAACGDVLAQFARVRGALPGVQLVAVGSAGDRARLARPPRPFPVGWDRDRAVAAAYGLAGCPQLHFARRGGRVAEVTRRVLSDRELVARARRLGGRG